VSSNNYWQTGSGRYGSPFARTKQNKTKQNKTKQNKTKQNKTKQNKTKQQNANLCLRAN